MQRLPSIFAPGGGLIGKKGKVEEGGDGRQIRRVPIGFSDKIWH